MAEVVTTAIAATRTAVAEGSAGGRMPVDLGGEWNVGGDGPQFQGHVPFPGGSVRFDCDFPEAMGGGGHAPNPLAYCLWGGIACYAMTFATEAALAGIELRSLRARVTTEVDQRRMLGLADVPPVERLRWTLEVDSDAPAGAVDEIRALADARCPGHYCLTNPIPLETTVEAVVSADGAAAER